MSVRRVLFVIALAATCTGACAKVTVRHVTKPPSPEQKLQEEGIFYALPKTVAKVQVKIEKKADTAAPYMMFAPIFAPGASALCDGPNACRTKTDSTSYSLAQGATFTTFGEPDPEHVYLVQLAGGKTEDQTIAMAWTETGLATAAAASVTNRTVDVAIAGIKLATNLGTKAFLGAANVAALKVTPACPGTGAATPTDAWVIPELQTVEGGGPASELAIANYCAMPIKLRMEYIAADRTLLQGAVMAFNLRVLPFAASRYSLLTSPSNLLDPVTLVDRLDTIINAELKNLFLGTSEKTAWEPTFEVRDFAETPLALLQLDAMKGPCRKAELAVDSKPMPAGFAAKDLSCASADPAATFTVALYPKTGQLFETVKDRVKTPEDNTDRSFRYRIPAQVRATITFGGNDLGSGIFSVAQLGHVVSLPAQRASKTLGYDLAFIEATGGLRSFKLGSTGGLDAGTIQAISEAGGTVLDARNAASAKADAEAKATAAAAATAADELTIVTREHTLLKLKHEICTIQKQYGLACTVQP